MFRILELASQASLEHDEEVDRILDNPVGIYLFALFAYPYELQPLSAENSSDAPVWRQICFESVASQRMKHTRTIGF